MFYIVGECICFLFQVVGCVPGDAWRFDLTSSRSVCSHTKGDDYYRQRRALNGLCASGVITSGGCGIIQ